MSSLPNTDYASILKETTHENLFISMSDINHLIEEIGNEHIKRIDRPKTTSKLKFDFITESEQVPQSEIDTRLTMTKILTKKDLVEIDLAFDLKNIFGIEDINL